MSKWAQKLRVSVTQSIGPANEQHHQPHPTLNSNPNSVALSPSLTTATPASSTSSSSSSSTPLLSFFLNPNRTNSRIIFLSRTTAISCSININQVLNDSPTLNLHASVSTPKSKRKLRPSFNDQIKEKWSVKIDSLRKQFPWQEEDVVTNEVTSSSVVAVKQVRPDVAERVEKAVVVGGGGNSRRVLPPWLQDKEGGKSRTDGVGDEARLRVQFDDEEECGVRASYGMSFVEEVENAEGEFGCREEKGNEFKGVIDCGEEDNGGDFDGERDIGVFDDVIETVLNHEVKERAADSVIGAFDIGVRTVSNGEVKEPAAESVVGPLNYRVKTRLNGEVKEPAVSVVEAPYVDLVDKGTVKRLENSGALTSFDRTVDLPWVSKWDREGMENRKRVRSNTMEAEKLIPEHELKRLRNISLRMYERISVGPAGITQDVMDAVREK